MSYCPNCGFHLAYGVTPDPDLGYVSAVVAVNHDPRTCRWQVRGEGGNRSWTCEHGVTVDRHPNGWCDSGCCR